MTAPASSFFRHTDEIVAEVDLVALVFRIGLGSTVIHLRRAGSLEHTLGVERKGALELAISGIGTEIFLLSGSGVQRVVREFIDVKSRTDVPPCHPCG